ncbi:unnamed protein product [Linum trigynum]|uniref:Uncharacterized protein n=1 Tax=Linum trigynum TaxID=586398 RepID=A0AAV2F9X2_9ROSI
MPACLKILIQWSLPSKQLLGIVQPTCSADYKYRNQLKTHTVKSNHINEDQESLITITHGIHKHVDQGLRYPDESTMKPGEESTKPGNSKTRLRYPDAPASTPDEGSFDLERTDELTGEGMRFAKRWRSSEPLSL